LVLSYPHKQMQSA